MAKSIKLNFIFNMLLTMSSFIFPVITFPYISRALLPEGIGKVSLAISVIAYFDLFAQLGIPTYGIRACARVRNNRTELTRTAHELLVINLITTAISYVALTFALIFIPKLREERLLYVIVSSTMFLSAVGMEWLYKALEQYRYIAVRSLIFKAIALVSMFMLIHSGEDYVIYGVISIFAASASNILNFINAHKYIDFKPVGNYNFRRHLSAVFVFFAMTCATTLYTNLDTVMLGFMHGDAAVGIYNSAVKIKTVLVAVVTSLGAVLLPRVSTYIEQGLRHEFWRVSKKALNFVILLATPLCLYFVYFAQPSIYLLSGGEFENAITPMRIIMPTLIFIGITNILGLQILVPLLKEKVVLYSEITGAAVNLVFNLFLIPRFGVVGAAIGTVVAEFAVLVFQFVALKSEVSEAFRSIQYLKIIFALIVGSLCSLWVLKAGLSNFNTLVVSTLLFFGSYGVCLILTKETLVIEILGQLIDGAKRKLQKIRKGNE